MSALDDYTPEALAVLQDGQVSGEHANQLRWLADNAQMVGLVGVEMGKLAALGLEVDRRARLKEASA